MASRRSPDGFIAIPAKAARARGLLALAAVAALVLSGCGGDGGSSQSNSTGTTSGSSSEAGAGDGTAQKPQGQEKQAQGGGEESTAGGRQGPKVPRPKGERAPKISSKQRANATKVNMTVELGGLVRPDGYHDALAKASTCDGKDVPPTVSWDGTPSSAKELILFALNLAPIDEKLFFDWAVAGLDPSLSEIKEGKLPQGAVVGKNSFGKRAYSICPPDAKKGETYIFIVYAIPRRLSPKPGFDPLALREGALAQHGNSGFLATTYGVY